MKLLWIGLDGFSFRMAERTDDPFFRGLLDNSQYGISKSVLTDRDYPMTGPNWASLYTGVVPDVHGITDAGWLLDNLKYQDIRVNTIFDLIDAHFTQALMTLPLTYPAFQVNGWMISGFPTPKSLKDCYYPDEIEAFLPKGFKISYAKCTKGMSWDSIEDRSVKRTLKKTFYQLARDHISTFKKIYTARSTEVAFVGLTYIDRMNHLFLQNDADLQSAYSETLELVEDLIKFSVPENIIICSDHGFQEDARQHDLDGFYLIRGDRADKGRSDISITEIAPAVVETLELPGELGIPVRREKVKVKTQKLQEIKQRLQALGYI